MATTTKDQQDQAAVDFADQFDKPDEQKTPQSDDEAFGLAEAPADQANAGDGGEGGADAPGAGEPEDTPAAGAEEKRLADWEAKLKEQQEELDKRSAAMDSTNAQETQTGNADADDNAGKADGEETESSADEAAELADPGKALAEDFGPEFVELLRAFITQVVGAKVGEGIGGIKDTVDSVIAHLNQQSHDNHFKAVSAAHSDFNDIIDSPEFAAWSAALPPAGQADVERVTTSGSADDVIAMLTKFKQSKGADGDGGDDGALDAAEGVRSEGGLRLPASPAKGGGYEDAWNEA